MPCFEIIQVLDDHTLLDASARRCEYQSTFGSAMDAGHYIVIWPEYVTSPNYDRDAKFFGPFASHGDAQDAIKDSIVCYYRNRTARDDIATRAERVDSITSQDFSK